MHRQPETTQELPKEMQPEITQESPEEMHLESAQLEFAGAVSVNIQEEPEPAQRGISAASHILNKLKEASLFMGGLIAFVETWDVVPQLTGPKAFLLPKLLAVKTIIDCLLLVLTV
ncbi:hypothetical protein FF1_015478 [Malus domestica]